MINMNCRHVIFCATVFMLWSGCAPTRIVKPLAKGEQNISLSYGGALIRYGSVGMPLPLTTLAYAKGVSDKTTVFASLHTTAMLFGVLQTDIGICKQLYKNDAYNFGISINPVINFAIDRWQWNYKIWPEVDLNIYKGLGKKNRVYAGVANWFEFAAMRPHNEVQQHFIFVNPHVGYTFMQGKWGYTLEGKYLMSAIQTEPNAPNYVGINNKGAIGIYLNFSRKF